MDKVVTKILFISFCLLMSCNKLQDTQVEEHQIEKKYFSVTPTTWRVNQIFYEVHNVTFEITSNASWYCYVDGKGFNEGKLSKTEGEGNGATTYTFGDLIGGVGARESATVVFCWSDEDNKVNKKHCNLYRYIEYIGQ